MCTPSLRMLYYCVVPEEECRSHKVYFTSQVESGGFFFFSFCFCLFPFHLKCSLVGQKDCSKKSHEIQLFLHGSFIYRGQYWRRLPKQEVVNCGQFSVSHLAAYFIYISPGGRLLALLSVGNLPWLPAACCTTRLLFLWSRPISVLKYTPF